MSLPETYCTRGAGAGRRRGSGRQANDTALVEWATEIKVRAERKLGEITREIPTVPGKRTSPHDAERSKAQVLAEAGITTQQASRCERLAAIPEERFESAVAAARTSGISPKTMKTEA
jgi:hypothetical protein